MESRKTNVDLEGEYANVYRKTAFFYALDNLFLVVDTDDDALIEVRDVLTNAQLESKSVHEVFGNDHPKTLKDIKHAFSQSTMLKTVYTSYMLAVFAAFAVDAIYEGFSVIFNHDRQRFFLDEILLMLIVVGLGEMMLWGFRVVASKRFDWLHKKFIRALRISLFLFMGVSYVILRRNVPSLDIQLRTSAIWLLAVMHYAVFWTELIFVGRKDLKNRREGEVNKTKEAYWFKRLDETYVDVNEQRMIQHKRPLSDAQIVLSIKKNQRQRRTFSMAMSMLSMAFIMLLILFGHLWGYSLAWGGLFFLASLGLVGSVLFIRNDKTVVHYTYWLKKRNLEVFDIGVWDYYQSCTLQDESQA